MKKWILLAALLPPITWFLAPVFKLYPYRVCYSENVYIAQESNRDVLRVSRIWLQSHPGSVLGSYQGSLYFFSNGLITERKFMTRTFDARMLSRLNAVEVRIENTGFISGIHDDVPQYRHYLDPYMQKGLKSHLRLFSSGNNKLMAGLADRPRLICNNVKKTIYPLR